MSGWGSRLGSGVLRRVGSRGIFEDAELPDREKSARQLQAETGEYPKRGLIFCHELVTPRRKESTKSTHAALAH